jgi:integrase
MAATVSFRLNKPREKKDGPFKTTPCAILICYYRNGLEVELSSGLKVVPANFTGSRVSKETPLSKQINKALADRESDLLNVEFKNPAISKEEEERIVRALIKGESTETPTTEKKTVIEAVQRFIAQYEREKELGTVKRYRALLKKLLTFNPNLTFEKLDQNFYDAFKEFLHNNHNPVYRSYSLFRTGDGYTLGMAGDLSGEPVPLMDDVVFKYFINIKTLCAWAAKRDYVVNQAYKGWEIIKREYTPITLTKDELERLESHHYPERHLDIARDYLVLESRTGQRISDLRRFKRDDLAGDVWTFFQKKGNRIKAKLIELPLDGFAAPALVILQKYNYELPKISEQKLNENIKTACKLAGINQSMYIERWAGNRKIRIPGFKYEFISTHTGKKSFITILASEGVPVSILSILTGTSQRTIERHYLGRIEVSKVREQLKKGGDNKAIMKKLG